MNDIFKQYDLTARSLHWISFIVILWATLSGFYVALLNDDENIRLQISELNISITMVFIPVFCWRVFHRIKHGTPPYNNLLSKSETKIAMTMHALLYVLIMIVLFSGILMMKKDFTVFNLISVPRLIDTDWLQQTFFILHLYSTRILAICIALHILAVVKHEISGRRILKRMI